MDKMTDKIKVKPFDNLFMRCQFRFGSRLVGLHKGKRVGRFLEAQTGHMLACWGGLGLC